MSRARLVTGAARGQQAEGWSRAQRRAASGHVVRAAGDLPACHLQRSGDCDGESLSLVAAVCGALSAFSLLLSLDQPLCLLVSVLCLLHVSLSRWSSAPGAETLHQ